MDAINDIQCNITSSEIEVDKQQLNVITGMVSFGNDVTVNINYGDQPPMTNVNNLPNDGDVKKFEFTPHELVFLQ